jgi:hypothetical protein
MTGSLNLGVCWAYKAPRLSWDRGGEAHPRLVGQWYVASDQRLVWRWIQKSGLPSRCPADLRQDCTALSVDFPVSRLAMIGEECLEIPKATALMHRRARTSKPGSRASSPCR